MAIKYLADTNVFIYLLNKHPAIKPLLESEWGYSFITQIELLGKYGITSNEIKIVKAVLEICTSFPHTEVINETAIQIKQKRKI